MIIVNRKDDRITGAVNGKPFNILYSVEKFQNLSLNAARLDKSKNKKVYDDILVETNKLLEVDFQEEVASVNGFLKYRPATGKYYLVINKDTKNETISSVALPEVLADRIVESYENQQDYMPLVLTWRRYLAKFIDTTMTDEDLKYFAQYLTTEYINQEEVEQFRADGMTKEKATLAATYSDIAVTSSGYWVTYKVATVVKKIWTLKENKETGKKEKVQVEAFPSSKTIDEVTGEVTKTAGKPKYWEEVTFKPAIWDDGDKFMCDNELGYKYKIGKTHVLPDDANRNYDHTFGGGGLYIGGQRYIENYGAPDRKTLTCFVDPADIISFQHSGSAVRVNRLFVNGIMDIEGELQGMYFISDYAKESNILLAKRFEEVVKATQEVKKAHQNLDNERDALLSDVLDKKKK